MRPPLRLDDLLGPQPDDRIAVIHGDDELSYGDLKSAARRMAAALVAAGVARGERVGVLLPKSALECAAMFAPAFADGVLVPINPLLAPAQVGHILSDCEAAAIIIDGALLARHGAMLAAMERPPVVLLTGELVEEPPAGLRILPAFSDAALPPAVSIGEDVAAILYTSGSTGRPKGVMLSHTGMLAGARIVRTYLGLGPDERILSILPFSFDYGLNQLLTAVEQGAVILPFTFRFGDEIVAAIARHQVTGLAGVPTIWAMLTRAAPSLKRTALPSLRYITNSGGAVPAETVRRLGELLPTTRIFLMYGLTEAFRSTYLDPAETHRRPTSIGKAIPESEVFVVTADGRRAGPHEPGILVHRGPTVSLGYWRRPEETARVIQQNPLRPATEGRDLVCVSGDLAYADEEGFLFFVGRQDAMIKSAGYRISPAEVEDVLMASGRFREVAVIGLPDATLGQRVHAVAVAADGEAVDIAAVLQKAAADLAAYMLPRDIELVERMPVTANGKVDVKALVAERSSGGKP